MERNSSSKFDEIPLYELKAFSQDEIQPLVKQCIKKIELFQPSEEQNFFSEHLPKEVWDRPQWCQLLNDELMLSQTKRFALRVALRKYLKKIFGEKIDWPSKHELCIEAFHDICDQHLIKPPS